MSRQLSDSDRKLIAKMAQSSSLTYDQIARRFGVTPSAVSRIAREEDVRRHRSWTDAELAFLKENYQKRGARGCGKVLGRNHQVVSFKARQLGLHTDVGPYGRLRVYEGGGDVEGEG